jgi:cathepsin L
MKAVIALAAVATATPMGEFEHEFIKFVATHNRRYATKEEYNARLNAFSVNHNFVQEFNKKGSKQTTAINHMGDWTREEYRQLLGYKAHMKTPATEFEAVEDIVLASEVDWRAKGAVTPVKDQGRCGSCWTFSSTGSLEGRHFQKTGVLTSYSEQQLVDCCNNGTGGCYNSMGCNGGIMDEALTYSQTYDLATEADYPYTAQDGSCQVSHVKGAGYKNKAKTDISPKNKKAFKQSIAKGPTSIAIEADQMAFQFYNGGILDSGCGEQLDHGVLAVGYGKENGEEYAIVKNSWNKSWGTNGYVKISIDNDSCGLLNQPVRPI